MYLYMCGALVILHKYNLCDAFNLVNALCTLSDTRTHTFPLPPPTLRVRTYCTPQQRQICDCDSKTAIQFISGATITNLVNSLAAAITIKANTKTTTATNKTNVLKKDLPTIRTITIKAIAVNVEGTDSCNVVTQMNCFWCVCLILFFFFLFVAQPFFSALPINPIARWKKHVGQQAVVTAAFTRR